MRRRRKKSKMTHYHNHNPRAYNYNHNHNPTNLSFLLLDFIRKVFLWDNYFSRKLKNGMQVNHILKNKSSLVHKIGQWNSVQQGIRFKIRFSTVPIIILYCNIRDDITVLLENVCEIRSKKSTFCRRKSSWSYARTFDAKLFNFPPHEL